MRKKRKKKSNYSKLLNPFKHDLYHWLLVIPWFQFLCLVTLIYLSVNILFALGYASINGIANAEEGSLQDAFFFSIQTLSTVGYGSMYPVTLIAQILVTIEILVGLVLIAILTGLMFARFSRPTAKVIFSKVAVISKYHGIPTLMFRTANQRENRILEAQVQLTLVRNEVSPEGHHLRRFYDLNLMRSQTPIFALSWLVMHPITPDSPLDHANEHSLSHLDAEIWVTLTGLDETFSQTIHARYIYYVNDLLWNMRFLDIFERNDQGEMTIDLTRFHDVVPCELP
jgi:inward rectifier potassium channel